MYSIALICVTFVKMRPAPKSLTNQSRGEAGVGVASSRIRRFHHDFRLMIGRRVELRMRPITHPLSVRIQAGENRKLLLLLLPPLESIS